MLVSGQAFDGSTQMLQHAGIYRWFSEFRPVRTDVVYELLSILNLLGVCCFITRTYVGCNVCHSDQ
jgi:hypothetical protein